MINENFKTLLTFKCNNFSYQKKKNKDQVKRKSAKVKSEDRMGAELQYNDDEDVVYDENSYRSTPKSKNGDVSKEYKNLI